MVNPGLLFYRFSLGLIILISALVSTSKLVYASTPNKQNTVKLSSISPIELSNQNLTPGQQLSLSFEVNYQHGVEIYLDASQYNWQPFTFISHRISEPKWQNNQWHARHSVDVLVPLAGQYHSPEMTLNSYLNQQQQTITINQQAIKINSSFSADKASTTLTPKLTPKLTGIQTYSPVHNFKKSSPSIAIFVFIASLLVIVMIIIPLRKKQSKQVQQKSNNQSAQSPAELITKANSNSSGTDECDWQGLRECMLQYLGFDPLNSQIYTQISTQHLELSNRYISLRFSQNNKASFIKICQLCQQAAVNKSEASND